MSINNDSGSAPVVSTPRVLSWQEDTEVSPLSKHLVVRSTSTPSGPKAAPLRAHLLTSADALAILNEKEHKETGEGAGEGRKEKTQRRGTQTEC